MSMRVFLALSIQDPIELVQSNKRPNSRSLESSIFFVSFFPAFVSFLVFFSDSFFAISLVGALESFFF
jgi:hypothetical protein